MLKLAGRPGKEGLDCAFCRWGERRSLLGGDPQTVYQHLGCPFRREDLAPVVKDDGWFAETRPRMFALVECHESILRFECHFHQPHVVFFLKALERQHCPQDRCSFHTDERSPVNMVGNDGAIWSHHKLVKDMLVYLADERSEEHTSELQSPCNLVCRLLLEKKKTRIASTTSRHLMTSYAWHA